MWHRLTPTCLSAVLPVLLALLAPPVVSAESEAESDRFACQAGVTLARGVSLTYRLTGYTTDAAGINSSPNPLETTPMLAVEWRDRQGRVQTLLRSAALSDYEALAPDADFSRLPFDAAFRSLPNQAERLYAAPASVHGLYVSLRPTDGSPQQMQVVHYLRSGEFVRSTAGVCYPETEDRDQAVDPQLTELQAKLQARDWAGADRETRRLLAPDSVSLPPFDRAVVSPDLIRAIDQLWLTASAGRFGLSVQLRLWQAARAEHPTHPELAVDALRDRVGWKIAAPRSEVDFVSSDWRNESELMNSLTAPEGHFPWVGVSDAIVQHVAVPPEGFHCGSCTIDAMQLRYGRFYHYLPELMDRVEVALKV
ncbi:MAG: hypothetical protein EAZ61_06815 [Oscillatoriales cyanobacterium]|nr:MAG: hypothetical protein EAZ61_06815 [Oscillatoriales cyanobacterium]